MTLTVPPFYFQVDPTPFLQVCANASRLGSEVCTASAMYVEACAQHDVFLAMPNSCIDCESEVIDAANTADVVFVVEEGQCNSDIITHLRQIAIKLETMALRSLGKSGRSLSSSRLWLSEALVSQADRKKYRLWHSEASIGIT